MHFFHFAKSFIFIFKWSWRSRFVPTEYATANAAVESAFYFCIFHFPSAYTEGLACIALCVCHFRAHSLNSIYILFFSHGNHTEQPNNYSTRYTLHTCILCFCLGKIKRTKMCSLWVINGNNACHMHLLLPFGFGIYRPSHHHSHFYHHHTARRFIYFIFRKKKMMSGRMQHPTTQSRMAKQVHGCRSAFSMYYFWTWTLNSIYAKMV